MEEKIKILTEKLDELQKKFKIPGLSFAIIHKNKIISKEGLGYPISKLYPDYKKRFPEIKEWFTKKEITGVIENYDYERDDITIRHHLTHTSEGIPGENY
ncbi:MAG: hypothetical protein ACXAB9_14065, partial [Candidatus Thorarchaeota archaeon]